MAVIDKKYLTDLSEDRQYSSPVLASTPEIDWCRRTWSQNPRMPLETFALYKQRAPAWFLGTKLNTLTGLDAFPELDIIMGVNHYIDNIIMQGAYQVFEYDYTYYWRLNPELVGRTLDTLIPRCPLIISMPFAGQMNKHADMDDILTRCQELEIPVHIDAAWLSASRDIEFNFDHPAIQSVAMSMSKACALWDNRVGIRWSRQHDPKDSITIYNHFAMLPTHVVDMGLHFVQKISPDHLWNTYETRYNEVCRALYLRPTKLIHLAQSLDRSKTYGMKRLLEYT
jgi:hypothetical protein